MEQFCKNNEMLVKPTKAINCDLCGAPLIGKLCIHSGRSYYHINDCITYDECEIKEE